MHHILRTYVDIHSPISTYKLTPAEKISVGFRLALYDSPMARMQRARAEAVKEKKRIEHLTELKEDVFILTQQMREEGILKRQIALPRSEKENFEEISRNRDFVGISFSEVYCHPDLVTLLGEDLPVVYEIVPETLGVVES